jgi:MFS superfamily sulfate permease-like transporter
VAGLLRLGWIADLLSTPIVTGFLTGIAIHIVVSQLPDVFGIAGRPGTIFDHVAGLIAGASGANPWSLGIGLGVLVIALLLEVVDPRLPGALIAVALATLMTFLFPQETSNVALLGTLPRGWPTPVMPAWDAESLRELVPLALILALIIMMQTAAVSRSFAEPARPPVNVNRDFIGIGVANIGSALLGAFPVNASPPRTAVVREAGGTSQLGVLIAAGVVAVPALSGGHVLAHVPQSALAGVLLFVAVRIVRVSVIATVARQAPGEFALILLTAAAVIALPIPTGVAIGIGLSLLHGVWITTHTSVTEFRNLPGTTIWWPANGNDAAGTTRPGILVAGFPAPLLFANAQTFHRGMRTMIAARQPLSLVVLEGSGIADFDYTAAQTLRDLIAECRAQRIDFAVARLASERARAALAHFGILSELGEHRLFHSVAEALAAAETAPPC